MISKKILMIGNSFSLSAGHSFANLITASGNGIKLASAYIGGCSLQKHWAFMIQADTDGAFRPYRYDIWYNGNGKVFWEIVSGQEGATVNQMLKDDLYDVVTIQQASRFSWQKETYEPFAGELISRIRELQPQAEIKIQQTWSYWAQHAQLQKGSEWGIDQDEMYARLDGAYSLMAEKYGLLRIPTGRAVQIARERSSNKFQVVSQEQQDACIYPDLPPQAGDVVGSMSWRKDPATGEMKVARDDIHLNNRGRYLQGCVFAGAIYGLDPRVLTWEPDDIGKTDAAFLRECAYEALKAEKLPGF